MSFTVTHFEGAVVSKHGIYMDDGRAYTYFTGKISILEGKEMLGFAVTDDANWIARIESDDGSRSVNLPGCQVQAVMQGANFRDTSSTWAYCL